MNRNFLIVLKYSLVDKFKSKSFRVLATIIILISAAAIVVPQFMFPDDGEATSTTGTIGVISTNSDNTAYFSDLHKKYFPRTEIEETTLTENFDYIYVVDIDTGTVYVPKSFYTSLSTSPAETELFVKQYMIDKANDFKASDVEVKFTVVKQKITNSIDDAGSYFVGYAVKMLMYFLLIFAVNGLTPEIIEEKSSRELEVVLSSVDALSHMLAKILATLGYLLGLIILMVGTLFAAANIAPMFFEEGTKLVSVEFLSDVFSTMSTDVITFGIIMFLMVIFSSLVFLVIAITTASTYNTTEDLQSASTASIMILVVAFIASFAIMDVEVLKILSYVPIMNVLVSPSLALSGTISTLDMLISIVISIVALIVLSLGARKVYRYSIINYSTKGIFNTIKQMRKNK